MKRGLGNSEGLRVAVTGAAGDLGRLLLPRLLVDPDVREVLALDAAKPREDHPKLVFRRVALARPESDGALRDALGERPVDALYHLAFLTGRVHSGAFAHELEVAGSLQLLTALSRFPARRLILPSLTALYGARPQHPALVREGAPLLGCPASRFINDKVQVEQQFWAFARHHSEVELTVLRFAPIVGPTVDNPLTRWLRTRLLPTLLGFDPPWQVVHESDAVEALVRALHASVSGAFNVTGPDVLSLSALIRASGGVPMPLPRPLLRGAARLLESAGIAAVPQGLLDYLQFGWVADGARAREELGYAPRFDAWRAAQTLRRQ